MRREVEGRKSRGEGRWTRGGIKRRREGKGDQLDSWPILASLGE